MRLKPLIQHCVIAGLLALPISAWPAGLGKLSLQSGLGQPLSAEIELTSIQPGELDSLTARLADQRTYAQNRIEFGSALSRVRVALERRGDRPILRVTSAQPINEPFLDLLIELNWSTGRLLREYTFLLDPPGFTTTSSVDPAPAIPTQPVAAPPAAAPAPAAAPRAAAPAETVGSGIAAAKGAPAGDTYGPVKRGETLGKIAAQVKPDGVTLEQMLAALYRANSQAFDGNNMNRLRAGGVLKVPKAEEATAIPRADAMKEIRVQAADWRGYRDRLASAAPTSEGEGVRSVTGARISTAADSAGASGAGSDRLMLSKGDASGGGSGGIAARAESATASQKALAEANSRVVDLEKQVRDLQRLLELKSSALQSQQAAAEQAKGAATKSAPAAAAATATAPAASAPPPVAASSPAVAPTPTQTITPTSTTPAVATPDTTAAKAPEPSSDALKAAGDAAKEAALADAAKADAAKAEKAKAAAAAKAEADAAKAEKATAKQALKPPATQQEPSFLDDLMGSPMLLVGGGAAVGLGLVAWMLARRRRSTATKFEDSIGAGTDIRTSTVFGNTGGGVVNTGDNSLVSDFSREGLGNIDTGEVDPIAEAEVYLAYGRDNQAEEILKDALGKTPDRQEIRLKLLEIYAQQNKPSAFEDVAKEIHAATNGAGEVWAKSAQLGRGLDPANPLYEDKGEGAVADTRAALADLGAPDPQAKVAAAVEKTASETNLDIPDSPRKEVFVMPPALMLPETQSGPASTSGPATLSAPLAAAAAASVAAAAAPQASALHERAPLDFKLDSPPEPAPQATTPAMDFVTLDGPITLTGATTLSGPSTLAGVTLASPSVDIWGEKPLAAVNEKIEVTPGAPGDRPPPLTPSDIKSPSVAAAVAAGDATLEGFSPMTTSTVTRAPQPAGKLELDKLDLSFDPNRKVTEDPTPSVLDGQWHDAATKLDLAKAYQEMGDVDGAREILQEVMQEGDAAQKQEAQTFLEKLRA
jgi:pilus assembly protein FimV